MIDSLFLLPYNFLSLEKKMKTITFTNHEKMLVELCVRSMLCNLLNKDESAIDDFTGILFNLNGGCFGDQEHYIKDTDDWVFQLQTLRECLTKLMAEDRKKLNKEVGSLPYLLPEEKG